MPSVASRRTMAAVTGRRIGLISTYPPKLCGLATFAAALELELTSAGDRVDVVRIDDGDMLEEPIRVVQGELVNGDPSSVIRAAGVLSLCDVVIVQHEYGIYGGADGDEVLALMTAIDVPIIVVLHTVPRTPTTNQKRVLESVCAAADRVVVMTNNARTWLVGSYRVDEDKVEIIPHGAATPVSCGEVTATDQVTTDRHAMRGGSRHERLRLLTWGLLGPGKGIEHAISAVALLGRLRNRARYTVAGVTHPKVYARDGDAYRRSLIERSWAVRVASSVTFDDTYRDVPALTAFVASSTLVVLPYDSRDQVTSGVLVDAIAAGRPVIATAFPHAVELLADGAGIVVPHEDPVALAEALRAVITDPALLASMSAGAHRLAPSLQWSAVAEKYQQACDELVRNRAPVSA